MLGIIAFFSVMAFYVYFAAQQRNMLENTFLNVVAKIREIRNEALTSEAINIDGELKVPPGGYGLYIDQTSDPHTISKYVDVWNEEQGAKVDVENIPSVEPDHVYHANDRMIESFSLEANTYIKSLVVDGEEITDSISITFMPPDAESFIRINAVDGREFNEMKLTLAQEGNNVEKTVKFNRVSRFPVIEE